MPNQRILIADGDINRGRRVADALEVAGHACRVATQGAAGLEVALSEHPSIIIAQVELPLVDARKLAEILRANPRTRMVRFLFLGSQAIAGDGRIQSLGDVSDSNVDSDAGIDEIQSAAEDLLDRQARIERLEQHADTHRDFEGSLHELYPAELLHMLHLRNASGRLTLTPELDDGSSPDGFVVLVDGEIVSAATGFVSAEKALFRMLDWRCGEFHFEQTRIDGAVEIRTATRRVLAEGLRQLEEWNRLAPSLPPLASPVTLRVDRNELPNHVHPLTQEVLGLLEDVDRVGDIVDQCSQPDYQVLRTLHTLAEREIIEFGRAHIIPSQPTGHALFNEAQCRRLRGFAAPIGGRQTGRASVKLLVAAASPEVAAQFGDLLMKVPGVELTSQFERGGVGPRALEQIGRIAVDDDFEIDLIHLPRATHVEPIWTYASHRALGTIFLLDAEVSASAADLAPMTSSLSRRAGARTFHVVMLSPGERLSPDELRDNLSLIEEASLFLLPLEPGKDPSSLLRSLFARIVP